MRKNTEVGALEIPLCARIRRRASPERREESLRILATLSLRFLCGGEFLRILATLFKILVERILKDPRSQGF